MQPNYHPHFQSFLETAFVAIIALLPELFRILPKKSLPPPNLAPRNGTTKYKQATFHTAFRIRLSTTVRKMGFRNLTLSFRRSLSYLGS